MKSARALGFATSRHLHHVPGHDRSGGCRRRRKWLGFSTAALSSSRRGNRGAPLQCDENGKSNPCFLHVDDDRR
ncbi:hypothetical protein ELH84_32705 [Rhizobium ruizarguesonis]|nr:hypothetical protein ELH84_32705 [Rhizobium ruizarguesonis]